LKLDNGPLKLDNGPLKLDNGPLKLDNGPLNLDNGPLNLDNGPLKLDNGPLKLDNGPLKLDNGPLKLDNGPLKFHNGPLKLDNGPLKLHNGKLGETGGREGPLLPAVARRSTLGLSGWKRRSGRDHLQPATGRGGCQAGVVYRGPAKSPRVVPPELRRGSSYRRAAAADPAPQDRGGPARLGRKLSGAPELSLSCGKG
jgi:nestin